MDTCTLCTHCERGQYDRDVVGYAKFAGCASWTVQDRWCKASRWSPAVGSGQARFGRVRGRATYVTPSFIPTRRRHCYERKLRAYQGVPLDGLQGETPGHRRRQGRYKNPRTPKWRKPPCPLPRIAVPASSDLATLAVRQRTA